MKSIQDEISYLERDLEDRQRRIKSLEELARAYPDLVVHTSKDEIKRYCSKSMNEYVNVMDITHLCSCCEGAPLVIWPFSVIDGIKIFSDPPHFTIGFSNHYGFGEIPLSNWKEELKRAGINKLIVDKIQEFLRRHPPVDFDSVE